MEKREFTRQDADTVAALLEQLGRTIGDGVTAVHISLDRRMEVLLTLEAFRRLFREWTVQDWTVANAPYVATVRTTIGAVTYFALLRPDELPEWTPASVVA